MSQVTAIVLIVSDREEDVPDVPPPALAALQAWLRQADVGQLIAVDHVFGGWKHSGIVCLGGGFNHLDIAAFLQIFHDQDSTPRTGGAGLDDRG